MAIEVNDSRKAYVGNGVTVAFDAPAVEVGSELIVELFDLDSVLTVLVLDTDFTYDAVSGQVTLGVAPAVDWQLIIRRETALVQPVELEDLDLFPADAVEQALDRITRALQDLDERVSRAVTVSSVSDPEDLQTLLDNLAALLQQLDEIDAILGLGNLDDRYLRTDAPALVPDPSDALENLGIDGYDARITAAQETADAALPAAQAARRLTTEITASGSSSALILPLPAEGLSAKVIFEGLAPVASAATSLMFALSYDNQASWITANSALSWVFSGADTGASYTLANDTMRLSIPGGSVLYGPNDAVRGEVDVNLFGPIALFGDINGTFVRTGQRYVWYARAIAPTTRPTDALPGRPTHARLRWENNADFIEGGRVQVTRVA